MIQDRIRTTLCAVTLVACLLALSPAAAGTAVAGAAELITPAATTGTPGCTPQMVDLTAPEDYALLSLGTLVPAAPADAVMRAAGAEKVSRQEFFIQDDQGNIVGGWETTCTGSCSGGDCTLSGCEVNTGGCSSCSCSGLNCQYACTCTKKSVGSQAPAPAPGPVAPRN